jgi:hypothetical protein
MLLSLVVRAASDTASLAHTWSRLVCLQETVALAERQAVALVELPHSLAVAAVAVRLAATVEQVAQAASDAAVAVAVRLEMETHLEQVEQAAQVA